MKTTRIALAVAALACSLSIPAVAAPITLTASLGGLLSNSAQGSFDAASVLAGGRYSIGSLSYSFSFADDGDRIRTGAAVFDHQSISAYTASRPDRSVRDPQNSGKTVLAHYFDRDIINHYNVLSEGQQEGATLSLGGVVVGSNAAALSETTRTTTSAAVASTQGTQVSAGYATGCDSSGNNCTGWQSGEWNYHTDNTASSTTTTTRIWTGNFDISGTTTDRAIIDQLLNQQFLDFGLDLMGDLFLTGAQISFELNEIEAEVPEPSTIMLMLAALGGLGYSMRRRSAQQ